MNDERLVQISRKRQMTEAEHDHLTKMIEAQLAARTIPPQIPTIDLPSHIADNFITHPGDLVPDCQTCGACCVQYQRVVVEEDDPTPRGHYWKVSEDGSGGRRIRHMMLRRDPADGRCIALVGEIGKCASCSIYPARPQDCRIFEAGSDKCHATRRMYGLEPPLAEEEVLRALRIIEDNRVEAAYKESIVEVKILEAEGTTTRAVGVVLGSGELKVLTTFDPTEESFTEQDFLGLSYNDACMRLVSRHYEKLLAAHRASAETSG